MSWPKAELRRELDAGRYFQYYAGTLQEGCIHSADLSIDDIRKTLTLDAEGCLIESGKTVEDADCVCKTSAAMFGRIWNDGYRPGIMDFMGGAIKSNAPHLLPRLLSAFGT